MQQTSWLQSFKVYLELPVLRMLGLGFSAGLPLLLVLGTLSFRLREAGIDRTTIGYLTWVGLAYGFKWCWAPLVDRLPIPWLTARLGRRRSWLLLAQLIIIGGLIGMAMHDPKLSLTTVVMFAVVVAFGSATQDIALDAYRIESADEQRQAALAAAYQTGYRLAMIWAGAGVLWIAARVELVTVAKYDHSAWQVAYLCMAASMIIGVVTVLISKEPTQIDKVVAAAEKEKLISSFANEGLPLRWVFLLCLGVVVFIYQLFPTIWSLLNSGVSLLSLIESFIAPLLLITLGYLGYRYKWQELRISIHASLAPMCAWVHQTIYSPFADFVNRYKWHAALILALIAVYRISDIVMGVMANPFYVDMGYTKDQVAGVTKVYGVIMTLVGAFIGGVLSMRLGVMRVLMLGALLSAMSNLLFAWLAEQKAPGVAPSLQALVWIISADNLSSGIASAAFIAYLSSLTNIQYSATQYALFSSLMLLLPKFLAGFSGKVVDAVGYSPFFIGTAVLGLPVLVLVALASRQKAPSAH
jgi:MFS transporter, PAT family, beta-lactamase induction signal transducer AmpG